MPTEEPVGTPKIDQELERRFSNHPAQGDQRNRYAHLWEEAKHFAYLIRAVTPYTREQSLALTALEESVMWSIAAIARNE